MRATALADHLKLEQPYPADELASVAGIIESRAHADLRARLGSYTSMGAKIDLPLTQNTVPPRTAGLVQALYRLAEGYWRFREGNNSELWEAAQQDWQTFMDSEYGWASGSGYVAPLTLTAKRDGPSVTFAGTGWYPQVEIQGLKTAPMADERGSWSVTEDVEAGIYSFRQETPRPEYGGPVNWTRHQGPVVRRNRVA